MKKLLAVAALLTLAVVGLAADSARDGTKFNKPGSGTGNQSAATLPVPQLVGGILRSDTSSKAISLDASGNAYTLEASKDRDNWIVYANAINDTFSVGSLNNTRVAAIAANAGYSAESTQVYSCGQYRRFTIFLRGIGVTGDTTTKIRLAVQVRKHIAASADSNSTFAWGGWATSPSFTGADSLGVSFSGITISSSPGPVGLYPGEHLVVLDPRQRGDRNTDYFFGPPDGVALDLIDSKGQWFWAPYMSVRVRCLTGPGTVSVKPRIIMHVAMGS